ncbi:plastocyanin/azurin family copper-binding protein [Halostella salina]|uniref:plastocyanin/azurin family copper-binding protein n=1 Tax=Halostella salina TaxID=1547897 RepID=UPI00196A0EC2|nr:plastocyanin/azurin family copper-binding protein [Halostella salina]
MSRRRVLAASVGAAAGATAVGSRRGSAQEAVTVELVDFAFEPGTDDPLVVAPGTTVRFVWITDNHNVVVDSQPEGAGWEGHEPIENAGFEFEHTFETAGEYAFYCSPHQSLGMEGTIEVREGGAPAGEGPVGDLLPDPALTVAILSFGALLFVTFFVYFFSKYGGDYGE